MPAVLAAERGLPCLGLEWLVVTFGRLFLPLSLFGGETFDVKTPHFGPFAGVVSPPNAREVLAETTKVKGKKQTKKELEN